MNLEKSYSFEELTNEAERLVLQELGAQLEELQNTACLSQECVLDMAAYALNHVQPMYRVNLLGRLYAQSLGDEHKEEIRRAVADAIKKVSRDK
jgi:competence protein ComFB